MNNLETFTLNYETDEKWERLQALKEVKAISLPVAVIVYGFWTLFFSL